MYSIVKVTSGAYPVIGDLYLVDGDISDAVARSDVSGHSLYRLRLKTDNLLILIDVHFDEEHCTILRSDEYGRYVQAVRVITRNHPRWCATLAGWAMQNISKPTKINHQFEQIERKNKWIEPLPDVPATWYYDNHTESTIIIQA